MKNFIHAKEIADDHTLAATTAAEGDSVEIATVVVFELPKLVAPLLRPARV